MLRRHLTPNEGLLLVGNRENRSESAIHMLFMFFDITAVWLDSDLKVVDVQYARRWRLIYAPQSPAKYVIELHQDRLDDFQVGDIVKINETHLD